MTKVTGQARKDVKISSGLPAIKCIPVKSLSGATGYECGPGNDKITNQCQAREVKKKKKKRKEKRV